jgi:tRNA A37 N6-isopentenylltransferase MiaA
MRQGCEIISIDNSQNYIELTIKSNKNNNNNSDNNDNIDKI